MMEDRSFEDILPYLVALPKKREIKKESRLEELLLKRQSKKIVPDKRKKFQKKSIVLEEVVDEVKLKEVESSVTYSLFIPAKYGPNISYSAEDDTQSLEVAEEHSFLQVQKPLQEKSRYAISAVYNKEKQGYDITYTSEYQDKLEETRQDFTSKLDKFLEILPKSIMGGVLGFTYLGSGKMARREDLSGDFAHFVDVHEAIHTPDEYETRVLTAWMVKREAPKYKR